MTKNEQSNERALRIGTAFRAIRAIDYTVIFARDMVAMRRFYGDALGFPLLRELSPNWIEYRVGGNILALAKPSRERCADAKRQRIAQRGASVIARCLRAFVFVRNIFLHVAPPIPTNST
jgi:glyoxalase/bleomycin resistance protein/dioxygenase superfamily protein